MAVSATAPESAAAVMGVKRKPDLFDEPDEDHRQSLFIYNMTMSKLVTTAPTRHKPVEPSLQRSVLIRNTLRRLEASISMTAPVHPPHSPRKKLQCVGWPVAVTSTDSQTDFQLLLNGLVISAEESGSCTTPAPAAACVGLAASDSCAAAAMEVEPGGGGAASASSPLAPVAANAAEDDLAAAFLCQGQATAALAVSAAPPLLVASHALSASDAKPASASPGDGGAALAYVGDVDRVLVPRKDSAALCGLCSGPTSVADGLPRSAVTDGGFDEIDVSLLSELDAFCSAAVATRAASVVEEFDNVGCSAARDVRYDELDNILQVLVGM